jgi:hypothetical protein
MYCDDKVDDWMECLCTCEAYWECEWHQRLRAQDANRKELESEMREVVEVSHAIHMGVIDPPPAWRVIRGRHGDYWAPGNH